MNIVEKTVLWVVVIGLVIWGGMTFLKNGGTNVAKNNEPIKIGFVGDMSKDAANLGQNAQLGVGIAVKEINAKGGISGRMVEVIYEDGKCNGASASSATSKLINIDKVSAIIGGLCSGETLAMAPIAEKAKTPILSYCSSSPAITQSGDYIFRNYPSDSYQGVFAANYIYQTLGKKRVAVIYSKSDWGVGINETFTKKFAELGGTVIYDEGADQTTRDFRTAVGKAKEMKAEALYFPVYPESAIPGVRQIKEMKLDVPVVGADAWDDTSLWEKAGTSGEGMRYVSVAPASEEFKVRFLKDTGHDLSACGAQAYDAANVIFGTISKFGSSVEQIKNGLYATKEYQGVTGVIGFDQNGDLTSANYVLKVVKDGKAVEEK